MTSAPITIKSAQYGYIFLDRTSSGSYCWRIVGNQRVSRWYSSEDEAMMYPPR